MICPCIVQIGIFLHSQIAINASSENNDIQREYLKLELEDIIKRIKLRRDAIAPENMKELTDLR